MEHLKKEKKKTDSFFGKFETTNVNIEYLFPFLNSIVHGNGWSVGVVSCMKSGIQALAFPTADVHGAVVSSAERAPGTPGVSLGIHRMSFLPEWHSSDTSALPARDTWLSCGFVTGQQRLSSRQEPQQKARVAPDTPSGAVCREGLFYSW